MNLFLAYMRQHKKGILIFFVFCAIFYVCFRLYHLPVAAVLYPMLLCILSGCVFIITDFSRVKRKHNFLREIQSLPPSMIDFLPDVTTIEDEDYQAIICELQNEVKMEEAASSSKYNDMIEYYTIWVHQIKTPITSMRLSLEREDTALSRKLSSDLFQIEQYVEMVLAFMRLESDSSDYVFREHSIDSIIEQAITNFASEFIARKIHLEYTPTNEKAVTDDKWLSFVIEQVLSNALKYTREGEIKIYMRHPKTLYIEDTGIGIAPSDLPRVFERGYTGYNGRTDKRASGIGLYLCKRICKKLEIEISITSELDKGTIVKIDFEQYQLNKE